MLAALCASVLYVFPFVTAAAEPNFDYVDSIVQKAMAKAGTPAVSLAIVQRGKIVYEKAYGFRSLDPKIAATTATTFPIGSVSKQFLAATMVAMAREGKILARRPSLKIRSELHGRFADYHRTAALARGRYSRLLSPRLPYARIISPDFHAGVGRSTRTFAA